MIYAKRAPAHGDVRLSPPLDHVRDVGMRLPDELVQRQKRFAEILRVTGNAVELLFAQCPGGNLSGCQAVTIGQRAQADEGIETLLNVSPLDRRAPDGVGPVEHYEVDPGLCAGAHEIALR